MKLNHIYRGDCIQIMQTMEPNSIDAIVTDPPYNLHFMGKDWDKDLLHEQWLSEAFKVMKPGASMLVMGGTRTFHRLACAIEDTGFIIKDTLMWIYGSGFPKAQDLGKMIDKRNGRNPCQQFIDYLNKKRIEIGLNFNQINKQLNMAITGGGTASSIMGDKIHNILPTLEVYKKLKKILSLDDRFDKLIEREEAEREIIGKAKTNLTVYQNIGDTNKGGSINISSPETDLAKHWDGFKIGGIKPAYEPIIWAVKPPEGSYIDNVLKWGVGAVNVDECRVETEYTRDRITNSNQSIYGGNALLKSKTIQTTSRDGNSKGRFPANIILDEEAGKAMDEQSGDIKNGYRKNISQQHGAFFGNAGKEQGERGYFDSGGASRFFYCAKASRSERNAGLEGAEKEDVWKTDSRYNKYNKTSKSGECKRQLCQNNHPTVKPISLMSWLIKLVTREGQIVLDPFLGSGTTAVSAIKSNRKFIGIEREDEYIKIAQERIKHCESQAVQMEL